MARWMYGAAPTATDETDTALAAFGLYLDGARPAPDPPRVWPCNRKTAHLFAAARTQWRPGPNGPTGLDYSAVATTARALRIKLNARRLLDLQVMELAALGALAERRDH